MYVAPFATVALVVLLYQRYDPLAGAPLAVSATVPAPKRTLPLTVVEAVTTGDIVATMGVRGVLSSPVDVL
jgi:hypothetical protein